MNRTDIERACRNLDWNLLHTFLVVAKERGVTRAAKRLLVTQPAVTNALKRLENSFSCKLIERGQSTFTLTPAGQLLYEECLELYSGVSRIVEVLGSARDEVTGHVTIAALTHSDSPIIDASLARFHREHPRATLSIKVVTSGDVVTLVKRKAASCGISLSSAASQGLQCDMIYREQFALYCGRGNRLYGRHDISREEVLEQAYVTFPTDSADGEMADFYHARVRMGINKTPVCQSYHLEELRRMIEIGVGIGPYPMHAADRLVKEGRLWLLPRLGESPVFEVALITNPKTRRNAAESAFINIMRDEIAKTPIEQRSYLPTE